MVKNYFALHYSCTPSPHIVVLVWWRRWEQLKPALPAAKCPEAKPTLKLVCTEECPANEDVYFLMKMLHFMLCSVSEWDLTKSTFSRMLLCIIGNHVRLALCYKSWGKKKQKQLLSICPVLVCSTRASVSFTSRCTELTKRGNPSSYEMFLMSVLCDVVALEMGFLRDETTEECRTGTETALNEAGSGGWLQFTLRMLYPAVNAHRG